MLIIAAILAAVSGMIVWIYWPELIGAGWSPTPMENVRKMLEMADVKKDDLVYDLGCGDGRIIAVAAAEFGARAVGIEADPLRFFLSWMRIKLRGLGRQVKVVWGDFFNHDLSDATVVCVFLSHKANSRLKRKLERELTPGTRIVSYYWTFGGWKAVKIDPSSNLYLYRI